MKELFTLLLIATAASVVLDSGAPQGDQHLQDLPATELQSSENPSERKLTDYQNSSDPSLFLNLVTPGNQQSSVLEGQSKRLLYLRRTDRWLTKLQSKLDRIKFIIKTRLEVMNNNLHKSYKKKGFHPIIKYHRMYNQLMNPVVNPYLQQSINNQLMASPEAQADPNYQAYQTQLHNYADTYANSIAQFNSGLFYDPPSAKGKAIGGGISNGLPNMDLSQSIGSLASLGSLGATTGISGLQDTSASQSVPGFAGVSAENDNRLRAK